MQVNYYTTSAPPVPGAVTGPGGSRQEGYGFVTFEECNVAEVVLTMGMHNVDGIEVMCSFSTERGSNNGPGPKGPGGRFGAGNFAGGYGSHSGVGRGNGRSSSHQQQPFVLSGASFDMTSLSKPLNEYELFQQRF